jgi:hypothetical protein
VARESISVPVSREPFYEAVAVFLAVLAYPDQNQENRRARFAAAWSREYLRARANADDAFAGEPQPIRRGLFIMSDAEVTTEMREGAKLLAERKTAIVYAHPLFEAAVSGSEIAEIGTSDTKTKNNAEGRARLTKYWQDENWDFDSKSAARNLTTRELRRSLPVIHAAMAYWDRVPEIRRVWKEASEVNVERAVQNDRILFGQVINLAEGYRLIAPQIAGLKVREDDLIEFRAV